MLREGFVALVSAVLLLVGCGDDDSGEPTANDQAAADEALAAVEQSLRDDGFSAAADQDDDDDLVFESQECREFDEALPGEDQDLAGETASAESDDFERGELASAGGVLETVQAFTGFVEEPDDLDPVLELLNDGRLGQCLEEAFRIGTEAAAAEDQATVEFGGFEVEQLGSEGLGAAGGGGQLTGASHT